MPQGIAALASAAGLRFRPNSPTWLAYLHDARGLHHRRSFLPAGKACRLGAIGIDAREFLPVRVVHSHLPMTVLSTPVFPERGALFGFFQGLFQL